MEYVYTCAFVYTIMYHLCDTQLSDVSLVRNFLVLQFSERKKRCPILPGLYNFSNDVVLACTQINQIHSSKSM